MLYMASTGREKIIVGIAAFLFFSAFVAVLYMDRSHGTIGEGIAQEDFTALIERNQGHLSLPEFPDDLIILAASQDASLDLTVTNNDQDNDIDTVYITIPGSEIVNSTTEWYDPLFIHEWEHHSPSPGVARLSARDDLPGRNFGGSAMYDVAGNIDDALDHDSLLGISESVTITLDIRAPSTPGPKMGTEGIDLKVADEQTEDPDSTERYSVDPFPYPYLVIDRDYEFIFYRLSGENVDLDIDLGGLILFGGRTRGSDIRTSEYGFKYTTSDGSIVALIEVPEEDTIIDPLIIAKGDGGGQFTLDMIIFKTLEIDQDQPSSSWVEEVISQMGYTDDVPASADEILELDIDGDGVFTNNDDDIDGDGILNEQDSSPLDGTIANHHPVIHEITASSSKVPKNRDLTLVADADDADQNSLSFRWSVEPDPGWLGVGSSVDVDMEDFESGQYTFTVEVTDGKGGRDQDSIMVEITEEESSPWTTVLLIFIVAVILVVIILVILLLVRSRRHDDLQDQEEEPPEDPEVQLQYPDEETVKPPEIITDEETPEPSEDVSEWEVDEIQDIYDLMDDVNSPEGDLTPDTCPECGGELGEMDTRCSNCGAEFTLKFECPFCGEEVEDGSESCPHCGREFDTTG